MPESFVRSVPLDDIRIRSAADGGSDGRTVEAYAAVFDHEQEISDFQGRYLETIARTAFNKTLKERGINFGVFYNHGMTIAGGSSDRASVPLGVPLEVVADAHGLRTVSRYNKTQFADDILESIRNGDITAMSFSGRFVKSTPEPSIYGYPEGERGALTRVTRHEISLREFGPTPIPAYDAATIQGVRALPWDLGSLTRSERDMLIAKLTALPVTHSGEPMTEPRAQQRNVRAAILAANLALTGRGTDDVQPPAAGRPAD